MQGLKSVYSQNRLTATYLVLWPVLLFFSLVYLTAVSIRRFLYKKNIFESYRPKGRVISIGNITLGGSGKTPLVEYLALYLSARSHHVAILMRGYKKPKGIAGPGSPDYYSSGDEACMLKNILKENVVVISRKDRMQAAKDVDGEGRFGTIILDDGFQHLRIKRDLDVVVVDATNPFGNGCVLPLGPLRETRASLSRAQVICLTRVNEASSIGVSQLYSYLEKINRDAILIKAVHEPEFFYEAVSGIKFPLDHLNSRKAGLLCAIANPSSFSHAAKMCGVNVVINNFFDDHHEFSERELSEVVQRSIDKGAEALITTQKDVVRLAGWLSAQKPGIDVFVLKISLKIVEGEAAFDGRLYSLYSA